MEKVKQKIASSRSNEFLPPLLRKTTTNLNEYEWSQYDEDAESQHWFKAAERIRHSQHLTEEHRSSMLRELAGKFIIVFGDDNRTKSYESLKAETKFLCELTRHSLVHMAARLLIIRDRKLYRQDGYDNFKSFVEEELPISRSTVYNYIDIASYFQVQSVGHDDLEYTKLLPVLPLLKSSNRTIPKDQLRNYFFDLAQTKSKREVEEEANRYRIEYGLAKTRSISAEQLLHYVRKNLPMHPTNDEKDILEEILGLIELSLE